MRSPSVECVKPQRKRYSRPSRLLKDDERKWFNIGPPLENIKEDKGQSKLGKPPMSALPP